jgi:hypothetical protein
LQSWLSLPSTFLFRIEHNWTQNSQLSRRSLLWRSLESAGTIEHGWE